MSRGHVLKKILEADHALAELWMARRLAKEESTASSFEEERIMKELAPSLPLESRRRLVAAVTKGRPRLAETLVAFIGDDEASCREIFARKDLTHAHDVLLEGWPDSQWLVRAKIALVAGYEPDDVARISFHGGVHFHGPASDYWGSRRDAFLTLLEGQDDPKVHAALQEAARLAGERSAQAAEEERRKTIFGSA
jgi:hypothetical protein